MNNYIFPFSLSKKSQFPSFLEIENKFLLG